MDGQGGLNNMRAWKVLPNGSIISPEDYKRRGWCGKTGPTKPQASSLIINENFLVNTGWDLPQGWSMSNGLTTSSFLVDSYPQNNANLGYQFNSGTTALAQSFLPKTGFLNYCKFYLSKSGSPTGNAVAKLYAHSGTFGVSSKPTGAASAVSNNVDVSTFKTSAQLITFNFSGVNQVLLSGSLCLAVEHVESTGSNFIRGHVDSSSPTAPGNMSDGGGGIWFVFSTWDLIFFVYATPSIGASRDLGLIKNSQYSISVTINSTAGSITAKLGDGTSQECLNGTTTFTGTQGEGHFTLTPSADFSGTITNLTINKV